jgi:hypothetical protein
MSLSNTNDCEGNLSFFSAGNGGMDPCILMAAPVVQMQAKFQHTNVTALQTIHQGFGISLELMMVSFLTLELWWRSTKSRIRCSLVGCFAYCYRTPPPLQLLLPLVPSCALSFFFLLSSFLCPIPLFLFPALLSHPSTFSSFAYPCHYCFAIYFLTLLDCHNKH